MSTTVDANVLLYAADEISPFHDRAERLIAHLVGSGTLLHLFWPVLIAFVRIGTNPRLFNRPLTTAFVLADIEEVLSQPNVRVSGEGERFWTSFRRVAEDVEPKGNLVTDAHLVALMHEHGVSTIWTHDRDFRKFSGITVKDPFADKYAKGFA